MPGTQAKDHAWREMLQEFRALGGTADNICSREGPRGRGLFPIDASLPVALHAPENLLLPIEEVVFENGKFRVAQTSKMGSAEKAWIEHYENEFSWGAGGREEVETLLEGMCALPDAPREKLSAVFSITYAVGAVTPESVQKRFLDSRVISSNKRRLVMPIIELVNHGQARGYDGTAGVAVRGTFSDEVLVSYSGRDALGFFQTWGFSTDQGIAYSLPILARTKEDRDFGELKVDRDLDEGTALKIDSMGGFEVSLPRFSEKDTGGALTFLMLGNKRFPRMPRAIFQKVFRDANRRISDERFELLRRTNAMLFLELLGDLETLDGPMVIALRTMCRFQLESLAFCFGTLHL